MMPYCSTSVSMSYCTSTSSSWRARPRAMYRLLALSSSCKGMKLREPISPRKLAAVWAISSAVSSSPFS